MSLLLALLLACDAADGPCPNGSMAEGDAGLVVTADEHPTGWGEASCLECHAVATLHDAGCTSWVDPVALRAEVDAAVETQGAGACVACHGDNGSTP